MFYFLFCFFSHFQKGKIGSTYNIGGNNEIENLKVVELICEILDVLAPKTRSYLELINFVEDRPGHDRRYSIDCSKIKSELEWEPSKNFKIGLQETILWYLQNESWVSEVKKRYEGTRLGVNL